ncbi:upstream of flc-like protein [Tanacetum coccineum]
MDLISKSPRKTIDQLHYMSKKWKDRRNECSPEHNKVWVEPNNRQRRVAVVYYLTRYGQLEHPHFVEVTLSSSDGLYLRDVIDRLNALRGKGMAASYSWSSKRSYKNGFVWHDLSKNDFIYPAHGQEYILKGSELFNNPTSSLTSDSNEPITPISKNKSWTTVDLHEYKVYSNDSLSSVARVAANASTQTDGARHNRRALITNLEENDKNNKSFSEISRSEISPPPSDSSPETLESLMKSDGISIVRSEIDEVNPTAENKTKASSVLMQLITCGSISFRDCGPGVYCKQNPVFNEGCDRVDEGAGEGNGENGVVWMSKNAKGKNVSEGKEHFSGSLMETKKDDFPQGLKRSNSYNADG